MKALWWALMGVMLATAGLARAQNGAPMASPRPQSMTAMPMSGVPAPAVAGAPGVPGAMVQGPGLAGLGVDYRISPNDLIEVEVYGVPDLKRTVRVNSSGLVSLPLVGPVSIGGLTAEQAEARLAQVYGDKYLQNPQVSIFIREFTTQRITMEGAVRSPGVYPFTGQITLMRAIAQAGGRGDLADMSQVVIFRNVPGGEPESKVYDMTEIQSGTATDPLLKADDVIVVKRAPGRVVIRDSIFGDIIGIFNPFSYLGK
jgi:polysaccharide export outer membrane protein